MERMLTPEAEEERYLFDNEYVDGCCSCHLTPPCGYCTHPGNPANQEDNEECWMSAKFIEGAGRVEFRIAAQYAIYRMNGTRIRNTWSMAPCRSRQRPCAWHVTRQHPDRTYKVIGRFRTLKAAVSKAEHLAQLHKTEALISGTVPQ